MIFLSFILSVLLLRVKSQISLYLRKQKYKVTPRSGSSVLPACPVTLYCNTLTDVLWICLTIISLPRLHAVKLFPRDILSIEEHNATGLGVRLCL